MPKLKPKEGGKENNATTKSSKKDAFKEVSLKEFLSLKGYFNNKITI